MLEMATVQSGCTPTETSVSTAAKTFTPFGIAEILGLNASSSQEETANANANVECISSLAQVQLQTATYAATSISGSGAVVYSPDNPPFSLPVPWVTAVTPTALPLVPSPQLPCLHLLPSWPLKTRLSSVKGRKSRTVFTTDQVDLLEAKFAANKYLSVPERIKISQELDLSEQQVKTWFQNRRTKWRRRLREQDQEEVDQASGVEQAEETSTQQELEGEVYSESEEEY